jgi:hypothetical protein
LLTQGANGITEVKAEGFIKIGTLTESVYSQFIVNSGGTLSVGAVVETNGFLIASGKSASISVGTLDLRYTYQGPNGGVTQDGYLIASGGAVIDIGTLENSGFGSVTLDTTSIIDVGGTSGTVGALTVESGATETLTGPFLVSGSVVVNGTLDSSSVGFYNGSLAGTGTVEYSSAEISDNITTSGLSPLANSGGELLVEANIGSGNKIILAGSNDILQLGSVYSGSQMEYLPANIGATVNGFNGTDVLVLNGTLITNAAYGGGTLSLLDGSTTVDTLSLAGDYSGESFISNSVNSTQTQIIVLPAAVTGSAGTLGVATQPNVTVALSQIT